MPTPDRFLKAKTMNQRELIERDRDYIAVKEIILNFMDGGGSTLWFTDDLWANIIRETRKIATAKYHKIMNDMLDDPEIERECNREVFPNLKRWVMREK